jgi:hypothetical protein
MMGQRAASVKGQEKRQEDGLRLAREHVLAVLRTPRTIALCSGALVAALCVTSMTCRSAKQPPTVSLPDSSITPTTAALSQNAAIDVTPDAAASARSSATVPVLDTPPWPDGATKLLLTWVVYPAVMRAVRGGADVPTRRIELVVRAGTAARRFATEDRYSVMYATAMQRRCQGPPFERARVAELYMNGGGNSVFAIDRRADELVLTHAISTDGLCEPAPCPAPSVTLARIPIPPRVAIEERFHIVDDASHEHDETCAPAQDDP